MTELYIFLLSLLLLSGTEILPVKIISAFQIYTDISINQMKKNENLFMQLFLHITFNLPYTLKYVLLREEERERSIFALCEYKSNLLPWQYIFFHPVFSKHSLCFKFWVNSRSLCPPFTVPCSTDHFRSSTSWSTRSSTTFDRDFYFLVLVSI